MHEVFRQTKKKNISIFVISGLLASTALITYMGMDTTMLAPASADVPSTFSY